MVCFDMIKPPNRSHTGDPGDYVSRAGMDLYKKQPYPWSTPNSRFLWDKDIEIDKVIVEALEVSKYTRPTRFK